MIKGLWNIGIKTGDFKRELVFLEALGAKRVLHERLTIGDDHPEYAILALGGVRVLLFKNVLFEDRIDGGVRPGLTHAVYEVEDLDSEKIRVEALGAELLVEPVLASGGFGSRRLAFFRSPGGFVFEMFQALEDKLGPL